MFEKHETFYLIVLKVLTWRSFRFRTFKLYPLLFLTRIPVFTRNFKFKLFSEISYHNTDDLFLKLDKV